MKKLYNIELFRFIFSLLIAYGHMMLFYLLPVNKDIFSWCNMGQTWDATLTIVDCFFLMTGFFMFNTITNKKDVTTLQFAKGKIIRLWPVYFFSFVVFFVLSKFKVCSFNLYDDILNLLFLQCSGHKLSLGDSGYSWYISSLFWVSIFYFYILRNFSQKSTRLTIALITFFSYILLIHKFNGGVGAHISPPILDLFTPGILRALGGIGLGYFVGEIFNSVKNIDYKDLKIAKRVFISTLEIILTMFLLYNYVIKRVYNNALLYILAFALLLLLLALQFGKYSQVLNRKGFEYIGRYSYSIYIMHQPVFLTLKKYLWTKDYVTANPIESVLIGLFTCLIVGILTYHLIEQPGRKLLKYVLK